MKFVPLNSVLAEIENIRKHYIERDDFDNGWNFALDKVLSFIDSLEVKEVDLEKEISNFLDNGMALQLDWTQCNIEVKPNGLRDFAKHFFELGLNVSNPLTWEDMKLIWTIGDEIPYMPEEDFFKELLKRFKEKKGG